MGRGLFYGQPCPTQRAQRSPILGSLLFMHTPFVTKTTKFDVVTRRRGECFLGLATRPIPRMRSSRATQFCKAFLYLHLHHLTQNYESRHGNTYREWRVLGDQPRHSFAQCVARFVSDS